MESSVSILMSLLKITVITLQMYLKHSLELGVQHSFLLSGMMQT